MFCPNCGKADQEEQTYCRQCGDILPKLKNGSISSQTRNKKLIDAQFLKGFAGLTGLVLGLALLYHYWGAESIHLVDLLAIAFSFAIGFWQISVFVMNWNVGKQAPRRRANEAVESAAGGGINGQTAETNELLPEANLKDIVPSSVTESTTRDLKEKVKRSTESE